MKSIVIAAMVGLFYALPVNAQTCGTECVPIVREAIQWLADKYDVAPQEIVMDSARSGLASPAAGQARIIAVSVFEQLARTMGFQQSTSDAVVECAGPPAFPGTCTMLKGSRLVRIAVDSLDPLTNQVILEVGTQGIHPKAGRWSSEVYVVTLQKAGDTWEVIDAKLALAS